MDIYILLTERRRRQHNINDVPDKSVSHLLSVGRAVQWAV